jgi:6-pyruvoyltetrahydropterin/6-carboxytetrahydropterin synthase
MYKVKIITSFSAAHSLRNYKGKCEALHGHNWKVEVLVSNPELNASRMVIDFSDLKSMTANVLEGLDHKHLNELDYFKEQNPSSEEIARYIFDSLKEAAASRGCRLEEVRVWETEAACAVYQG